MKAQAGVMPSYVAGLAPGGHPFASGVDGAQADQNGLEAKDRRCQGESIAQISRAIGRAMILTVAEAAKRLNVAPNTVYDLVERGELTHHRIGRAIRILSADIDPYQRQGAEAADLPPVGRLRRIGAQIPPHARPASGMVGPFAPAAHARQDRGRDAHQRHGLHRHATHGRRGSPPCAPHCRRNHLTLSRRELLGQR